MRLSLLAVPVGAIMFLMGLLWMLQGVGLLPGSVMTGSQFWAIAGALTMILGLAVVLLTLKKKDVTSQQIREEQRHS